MKIINGDKSVQELIFSIEHLKYKLFDKNVFGIIKDFFEVEKANIFYLYKKFKISPLPLGNDAVLSGSAMWFALTADKETKWLPKDLDIFCCRSAIPRMRKFLIGNKFSLFEIESQSYGFHEDSKRIIETWGIYEGELLRDDLINDEQKRIHFNNIEKWWSNYIWWGDDDGYCIFCF
jgi:hypothetical protein